MDTFLNVYFDKPMPKSNIKKHVLYSILWILDIGVFIFRLDVNLLIINNDLIRILIPFSLLIANIYIFFNQKWYYNLALLFYPFLLVFWFIPKMILQNGKLYLFLYYFGAILKCLVKFKRTLINTIIFTFFVILISSTGDKYVKIVCVIYFCFIFLKILYHHIFESFKRGSESKNVPVNTKSTFSKITW